MVRKKRPRIVKKKDPAKKPKPWIGVECGCGKVLEVHIGDWNANVVGVIQFICTTCGEVSDTPGLVKTRKVAQVVSKGEGS